MVTYSEEAVGFITDLSKIEGNDTRLELKQVT